MPKGHHRSSRSQGSYRSSPSITTPTYQYAPMPSLSRTLPPNPTTSTTYYTTTPSLQTTLSPLTQTTYSNSTNSTPTYSTPLGGPVQHPSRSTHHMYTPLPAQSSSSSHHLPPLPPAPTSLRPSSGAWTPHDDLLLMTARSQGLNWSPIQSTYFPTKTPNACRKRHERLMERKNADDWDDERLGRLGREYMGMRKEMWGELARRMGGGEKWATIEGKVFGLGVKGLGSAARRAGGRHLDSNTGGNSRSPNLIQYGTTGYDDNTIGGLDADGYSVQEAGGVEYDGASDRSGSYYANLSSGSNVSSAVSASRPEYEYRGDRYDTGRGDYETGRERVGSMGSMGIGSIINQPGGGR